jgi:hypothetical protein
MGHYEKEKVNASLALYCSISTSSKPKSEPAFRTITIIHNEE